MKKLLIFISFILFHPVIGQDKVPSPEEFFGYPAGKQFTAHHRVVRYFERLAERDAKARVIPYGYSYEGRPLLTMVISSEENMNDIENIRINHLKKTGLIEGDYTRDGKVVVWLSYSVHGNESSSTEAAIALAYHLLADKGKTTEEWLSKLIIIIDPCINPDGRERFVNWFRENRSSYMNPDRMDIQHQEPWPGGRMNHYLFDLNRDWAWATQVETQNRLSLYAEWMPQIHADYHEQGINNPYYFAPAARPYHEFITQWQRDFQKETGKNNARYFDQNQWLYFTKEQFDLFYPGYGDTYPVYSGAIGMTYEQAGGGSAGVGVLTETKDTLTLHDRVLHHLTTGLSTIEIAARQSSALEENFIKYFEKPGKTTPGTNQTYIIDHDTPDGKLKKLIWLLDQHRIRYGFAGKSLSVTGFDYTANNKTSIQVDEKDLVIPVNQPRSTLVRVLFEPAARLQDSLTYDITAWSLPYAYGLKAYATEKAIEPSDEPYTTGNVTELEDEAYAYAFMRASVNDIHFLAEILKRKIVVRTNTKPLKNNGITFPEGSLFILAGENSRYKGSLKDTLAVLADTLSIGIESLASGLSDSGIDLGSSSLRYIDQPVVGLLFGDFVSPYTTGAVWHLFEQEIGYPVHRIQPKYLSSLDWDKLDVLIIPQGYYSQVMTESVLKKISEWVRRGGRLILIGNALGYFADKEGFSLKEYLDDEDKEKVKSLEEKEDYLKKYEERERRRVSDMINGGIFKVRLDNSHPVAFGFPGHYFSLKTLEDRYALLEKGWNIGTIKGSEDLISGFAGNNTRARTYKSLVIGMEEKGRGAIIYFADDPVFRAFWENGKLLLCNAVFMP